MLQRQTPNKPLFPDLLWARPERKEQAGKLLIIGGSTHGFADTIKSYELAQEAGIGEVKIVLPRGVERYAGSSLDALYAAQVESGSLAREALQEIRVYLTWTNAILLPGELTNNGETTLLIEDILRIAPRPVIMAGDTVEQLLRSYGETRSANLVVLASYRQLQRIAYTYSGKQPLLSSSTLEQQVEIMQTLCTKLKLGALVRHDDGQILAVSPNQASLTGSSQSALQFAAHSAVLAAEFPSKLYESLTMAAIQ